MKPDSPSKTAEEFLAAAKASPGQLKYSSGGVGSPQHIGMALLAEMRTALKSQFELYRRLIQDNNIKAE